METLEKNLWGLFKKHLPMACHVQRVETGGTGQGIPDVNLCHLGEETWVQLKIVKGKKVMLSPQQVVWHHKRCNAAKGSSWILARDKADGVRKGKYDRLYLWKGGEAAEVFDKGVETPGAEVFNTPFDWPRLMAILFPKAHS